MLPISVVDQHVIYENPIPQIRSRHGYFPGIVKLPSGELLCLFALGKAFDAADVTTVVSRSHDQGHSWELEGPLHKKDNEHRYDSDYMKPNLLSDGTLLATGYRFHREDPDQSLANLQSDGLRGGDNLVSFSRDDGHAWADPRVIPRNRPELIEASGPSLQLQSGRILVAGSLFPVWEDGGNPSGVVGALLQSEDGGETWSDDTVFFKDKAGRYAPSEPRLCEMQKDRVVALCWTTDHIQATNLPNHVTVSHDGGTSWSDPIDTGIPAQASNLIHWEDNVLLTSHCHREGDDIGLYVRLVDFTNDRWQVIEELNIWDNAPAMKVAAYATMGLNLKFGQPSFLRLDNGDVLATHWAIEDGQGRIRTPRLSIRP